MAGLNKVTVDDINVKGKKVLVRVARDIRRVIRNEVEDKIAELLIDKGEGAVSAVAISADNGEIKVDAL